MTVRAPRLAIVCQPWDAVAFQSGNSIVIIACQLARYLPRHWRVTLYGRRAPGQQRYQRVGKTIEFKRCVVWQKPQALIEILLGILSFYTKTRINYLFSYSYHLLYALRVALDIRRSKYDVIVVLNFLQFAALIKLLNPSVRVCLYMQCEWLTQFVTPANARRVRKLDLIIGCSNYITEAIRTRFPEIADRCHTLYNGVDTDRFCPSPESGAPGISAKAERLLYVGRLSPEKGVHVLIEAFVMLVRNRPGLKLDLVGVSDTPRYLYLCPDPADPAIRSLEVFFGSRLSDMVRRQLVLRSRSYLGDLTTASAGDHRIIFHGAVAYSETIDFYRHAAVLVFPSVWNEPFGMPTIEASACGVPVVSTCSGGIPEIVKDGETGVLVERGDARGLALAISRILDNAALARAMGEAGRTRAVTHFSWNAASSRLAELIESVLPAEYSQTDTSQSGRPSASN